MELDKFLTENNLWHRFYNKPEAVHTADTATTTGVDLTRLTKSLVLVNQDKKAVLAIIPGNCKLSFSKLRHVIGAKKVRLVPFNEAEKYSGYVPGATPMVCHREEMQVVIDKRLTHYKTIYGGGGSRTRMLELKTDDVIKINHAVIADICEEYA